MNDVVSDEFVCQFEKLFSGLRSKRIVLYGIGYRTGAIVSSLSGKFNFVGLMDKEKSNIGKIKFGLKILDEETVIAGADCIIIISVSFYDVIFHRISYLSTEHGVDIYFPNGVKAEKSSKQYEPFEENYSTLNIEYCQELIQDHDVISFDLFDTLLMRRVLDSDVIFEVMDWKLRKDGISFYKLRKQAYIDAVAGGIPNIDTIYTQFGRLSGLSASQIQNIKELEIETEKRFLTERRDILALYNYARQIGKEVLIVTDMYLSSDTLYEILRDHNIEVERKKLIVSCEYCKDKQSGTLWKWVREKSGEGRKILHIGDNLQDDCLNALKYGISTIHILSAKDMMRHTIFNEFLKLELSLWNRVALGLIAEKLFNSPFIGRRIDNHGRVVLWDEYEIGYTGYACLIAEYLGYIIQRSEKMNIRRLLFCARDGYLLQRDLKKMQELGYGQYIESRYLKISRLLVRKASLFNDKYIDDFAMLPYSGRTADYYVNRFGITTGYDGGEIKIPEDWERVKEQIEPYRETIKLNSGKLRENYKAYVKNEMGNPVEAALVDFGYTGSSQYYLSLILNQPLTGFYLLADLDENNGYNRGQKKMSYIYDPADLRGTNSQMQKAFLLLESIFTAPYGTYISCNEEMVFETGESMTNNNLFKVKENVNDGILGFLQDIDTAFDGDAFGHEMEDEIGQRLLTTIFSENVFIDKELLDTFCVDDILNYRKDCKMFE